MSLALPFQTAKQLAAAVRKKKIGCLELLDLYLKRVEAYNPELNAIIATDIEGARKRAKAADRALKAGKKVGPLHGVPMTIKESFDIAGYPTTWGDPAFKRQRGRTELAGHSAYDRCRRHPVRQDQRAAEPRRLAELQRGLRLDQQSVGSRPHAGRLLGRFGCGTRRRPDRHRSRQRYRRLDPQSCALLRRVGPQAELGRRFAQGPCARRRRGLWRYRCRGPAGARCRRSRDRDGRHGRPRSRSTAAAGRSPCPARQRRSCATSRWRCC